MEQFKQMKLSLGIVMAIVAQSFGGIWYVAQLDSTVSSTADSVAALEATVSEMDERIDRLETRSDVIENEMRTIMADHGQFTEVLRSIGIAGYGDNRRYGDYD